MGNYSCCINWSNCFIGFYDIILSGGSDNNYDFSLVNGRLEVTGASGINNIENKKISIYPNPANQYLYINSESLIKKIELYDLSSNLILLETNTMDRIDVSALNAGLYILHVYTENKVIRQKVIVKH